jgi:sulfur-oxidizing protein SoxA
MKKRIVLLAAVAVAWTGSASAQTKDANAEFEKFRAEMEESNPAELFEVKGEELWKAKRGPKNVSLADTL